MNLFIEYAWKNPFYFFSWALIVVFSICVHEYSHASMASRLGDDTAARSGHLTLNPLAQMGISSLVMLGLFGIAWGAVPVDPFRLRGKKGALVSFAGPASNFTLCLIFAGLAAVMEATPGREAFPMISEFFFLGSAANGVLFLFNMLPVPMFDGWSVFSLFIPAMQRVSMQQAQTFSWFFLMLVFMTKIGSFIWTAGLYIAGALMAVWGGLFGLIV